MKCELCNSPQQDAVQIGLFMIRYKKAVHLNCLFLSDGLIRRDSDNVGFNGYLFRDISLRRQYFYSKKCCYCSKKYANIRCGKRNCQRSFHYICGIENQARNQYVEPYISYCHQHVLKPKYRPKSDEICCICYEILFDETDRFCPVSMLRSPCCRNHWFHKSCIQKFAIESGLSFRCPICNNTEEFRKGMLKWGVFTHGNPNEEDELIVDAGNEELDAIYNPLFDHDYDTGDYEYDYDAVYNEDSYNYIFYESNENRKCFHLNMKMFIYIAKNVLCHPFVILQQQSQVNFASERYHLLPFSLVPIIRKLHYQQGVWVFWKGLFECFCFNVISSILKKLHFFDEWPFIYVGFKGVIILMMYRLKVDGLTKTVGTLMNPNGNVIDYSTKFGSLFLTYLSLEFTKWAFSAFVKKIARALLRNKSTERIAPMENEKSIMQLDLITRIVTDTVFYPCETVVHRMLLQNTNTIIDNLDTGTTVKSIFTCFKGTKDCIKTTVCLEGYMGLYKGFGGLILQFAVHAAVVKIAKWLF